MSRTAINLLSRNTPRKTIERRGEQFGNNKGGPGVVRTLVSLELLEQWQHFGNNKGSPGVLSQKLNLHNPLVILAAFEAVIGLFIEISFIATFTQRFFGR
jgi:hypothetical protein